MSPEVLQPGTIILWDWRHYPDEPYMPWTIESLQLTTEVEPCKTNYNPQQQRTTFSSIAFFCKKCGEIWARVEIPDHEWKSTNRLCPTHGPGFLLPFQEEYLSLAPKEVLLREILLIQNEFEKNSDFNYTTGLSFGA